MVIKNPAFKELKYGTIIKCEGIAKAILDIKIYFFADNVIFEPHRVYF